MVDLRFRDIVRFSCGCNMVADFELKKLVKPLQDWFDGHARVLPWRDDPKAYKVWISEIMLQQTRVEAVKPYFARFMEALPDVEALAACPEDRYLKLWEGLGYYNRVRNLHAAAEQIMEQYGGTIPDTVEELLRLKGIGSYTAGAIASIAYNRPVPAVDGNVLRVISRVCADDSDIMKQSVRSAMERSLQAMMETEVTNGLIPRKFNQALMELGAMVCVPNGAPHCPECPWYGFCEARLQDKIDTIPVKTRAKARRIEERTVFVIRDGEHVALRKRPAKGTKRLAVLAMFTAIALTIFVAEAQIPPVVPIPGVKLGLANIVTLIAMALLGRRQAGEILLVRIVLGSVFTGGVSAMLFSIAGGVFAYLVMCLTIRRPPERLLWVVSVLAAFGHNAGQLLVAVWVTGTPSILVYAPALVAASVITGAFTGVAAMYLVRALRKTGHFPQA